MMHRLRTKVKRRRAAALATACVSAVLCLRGILAPPGYWEGAFGGSTFSFSLEELEEEDEAQMRRYLLRTLDQSHLMDEFSVPAGQDAATSSNSVSPIGTNNQTFAKSLTSYTLEDAMNEASPWKFSFAVMVYDPSSDKFLAYYSKNQGIRSSFDKLQSAMRHLSFMLKKAFPERFTPASEEWAVAISSGDYPHVNVGKMPHTTGKAPVLQFGSVFMEDSLYPNMIAMPMPGMHVKCFAKWADQKRVCEALRPMHDGEIPQGELAFGKELGLEWDNLKPQLVWRGTDFNYLNLVLKPRLKMPFDNSIGKLIEERKLAYPDDDQQGKKATVDVLRGDYDELLPRWKGVVMTAEAELEAKDGELPWANIKFAAHSARADKHKKFEEVGVAVGEYMSREDQASYKYHIDIAGGGGTTWTGTSSKLPMPGLLFHHITPTKDYFHDRLEPYVHYVPVSPDLSDLKDKYDWAESNPRQARQISDRATEFMRYLGTPEGFGQLYEEDFVEPLRRIIDAYRPISTTRPGGSWTDILEAEDSNMVRVLECRGLTYIRRASCEIFGKEVVERWKNSRGGYPGDHVEVKVKGIMDSRS